MTQVSTVRILVLGGKYVGKSAITVRFLTKRYIGEYKSNIDWFYRQMVESDKGRTSVEILDVSRCCQDEKDHSDIKEQINWAGAFVIIYSICDRHSFTRAEEFLRIVTNCQPALYLPIILVGNKCDLEFGRQVAVKEGKTIALKFGCQFYEISAADNHIGVSLAFNGLIRQVHDLNSRRTRGLLTNNRNNNNNNNNNSSNNTSNRQNTCKKLSMITLSRVLNAMFRKSQNHNYLNKKINKKGSNVMIPVIKKNTCDQ